MSTIDPSHCLRTAHALTRQLLRAGAELEAIALEGSDVVIRLRKAPRLAGQCVGRGFDANGPYRRLARTDRAVRIEWRERG